MQTEYKFVDSHDLLPMDLSILDQPGTYEIPGRVHSVIVDGTTKLVTIVYAVDVQRTTLTRSS